MRALLGLLGACWLAMTLSGCHVTDIPVWQPPKPMAEACEVDHFFGVPYYSAPDAHQHLHRLDLYLPHGKSPFPVVVLVHGGFWESGDNRCCGLYSSVGEFLARNGIGAVLPNYRLSPWVQHPEHIKDVARAVAWTKTHIGPYGGQADKLYIVGHSAGGHLVSLLATDESYLQAVGLKTEDLAAVAAVSGVYRLAQGPVELTLGGAHARALHWKQMVPLRQEAWPRPKLLSTGLPLRVNAFAKAFGDDPQVRADASPINHVRPGLPPFLLCYAEDDLPTLANLAQEFHQALQANGNEAHILAVPQRNHHSIIFRAIDGNDPVGAALLHFIRSHGTDGLVGE